MLAGDEEGIGTGDTRSIFVVKVCPRRRFAERWDWLGIINGARVDVFGTVPKALADIDEQLVSLDVGGAAMHPVTTTVGKIQAKHANVEADFQIINRGASQRLR